MKNLSCLILGLALAIAMETRSQAQSWLTNGLVAYYPFNGSAIDASGNGNDGVVSNAVLTTDRFGSTNAAYYFDGTSSYITTPIPSRAFSGDFTVSTWFKAFEINNGFPTLICEQNQAFDVFLVGTLSGGDPAKIGNLGAYAYNGAQPFNWFEISSHKAPLNTDCQVVVTKIDSLVSMYLNSQLVATSQVIQTNLATGQFLSIGLQDTNLTYTYFHGVIDDIRVYNRGLSTSEVAQLFKLESPPIVNLRKAVYVDCDNLGLGTNYQLQVTSDLSSWTNVGTSFTATNTSWRSTNYWDVDNWDKLFFRLQTVP